MSRALIGVGSVALTLVGLVTGCTGESSPGRSERALVGPPIEVDLERTDDESAEILSGLLAGARAEPDVAGRRVIVTLTDGEDLCRLPRRMCSSAGEVEDIAVDDGFMVYAIGMEGESLADRLTELAEKSGGGHRILEANAQLATAFAEVAAELRHQYTIGFTPRARDGRMHRLQVRVRRPDLTAKARQTYRAPRDERR